MPDEKNNYPTFEELLEELGLEDEESQHHESSLRGSDGTTDPVVGTKPAMEEIDLNLLLETDSGEPDNKLSTIEEDNPIEYSGGLHDGIDDVEEHETMDQSSNSEKDINSLSDEEIDAMLEKLGMPISYSGLDDDDDIDVDADESIEDEELDDEGWSFDEEGNSTEDAFTPVITPSRSLIPRTTPTPIEEDDKIEEDDDIFFKDEDDFDDNLDSDVDDDLDHDDLEEESEVLPKKGQPKKERGKDFKSKWDKFKQQAAAELHGEDPKKSKRKKNEEPEEKVEDSDKDDDDEKSSRKRSPQKIKGTSFKKLKKPFIWLSGLYHKVINFIFSVLDGILGFLGKIPFIGWPFRKLRQLTRILKFIANAIPVVLLIVTCVILNQKTVPSESTVELVDQGSASFGQFAWNDGQVTGVATNTGPTIAKVEPQFSIYTLQPSFNPISWFKPKEAGICRAKFISIPIDGQTQITAKCKKPEGFFPRVSGTLIED